MPGTKENSSKGRLGGWSLGRRLFALFVLFALGPLFISNFWGYWQTRNLYTETALRNVRNVAEMEATKTLEFIREKLELVGFVMATNRGLAYDMASLVEAKNSTELEDARTALREQLIVISKTSVALDLQVFSSDGTLQASSSSTRDTGKNFPGSACVERAAKSTNRFGFEHFGDEPTLVIADVLRTADEAVVGIFCVKYSFSVHHELVDAHEEHTSHADLYLLDEEGRVACSSFKHAHETKYGEHLDHQHRKFEATDESWSKKYRSESGEEVLAAFAPIKGLGWGVLVEVPTSHALHGLEHLKVQAFALSGLLAAVLTAVIFLTSRRLARQLRRLSSAASRIAGGALGDRVPTNGPEEVAELAAAFNQMSVSLHDSHRLLEKRIAERTRELRENQEFTELLLDSIHQRVVVVGRDRRIIKANRAARRMYGRDLTGELYDEAFEGRAEPGAGNPVTMTLESGEPARAERLQLTPHGQEILLVQTYPVDTKGDQVESVVEIARVITDEKQLQAQMTHHEKMAAFGLLAAGVAHEIGNPLASIQAQLRMSREARDPERTGQTLEVVDKEVARIGRLLRELVEFARRRRDEVVLVSLNRVVDDVVRLLGHDPRARNVRIETRRSSDLPGVRAREDDLVQVLLNLGINALDAMPDGGSLTFETAHIDGDVLVRVRDTGAGITREARAHLFEPFFTTKAPGRGTGLGLFVSKGIVEALEGRLELESSGHTGSVFRVVLNTDGSGQKNDSMRG